MRTGNGRGCTPANGTKTETASRDKLLLLSAWELDRIGGLSVRQADAAAQIRLACHDLASPLGPRRARGARLFA